jgi:hypothetical protein
MPTLATYQELVYGYLPPNMALGDGTLLKLIIDSLPDLIGLFGMCAQGGAFARLRAQKQLLRIVEPRGRFQRAVGRNFVASVLRDRFSDHQGEEEFDGAIEIATEAFTRAAERFTMVDAERIVFPSTAA